MAQALKVSLSTLFIAFLGFVRRFFLRVWKINWNKVSVLDSTSINLEKETEEVISELTDLDLDLDHNLKNINKDLEETQHLVFKFEYQTETIDEISKKYEEKGNNHIDIDLNSVSSPVDNNDNNEFEFEPEDLTTDEISDNEGLEEQDSKEETEEESVLSSGKEDSRQQIQPAEKSAHFEKTNQESLHHLHFLSENDFFETTDSVSSTSFLVSNGDEFLSELDIETNCEEDKSFEVEHSNLSAADELDDDHATNTKNSKLGPQENNPVQEGTGNANPDTKNTPESDTSDSNGLESLWEHQDLIEQLKLEIKKVKAATGLPTIFEESESPRLMEDLKPWKIDDKYQNEDRKNELQNFYKTYRERMRKFDILNYQKMYAIGFLQSKEAIKSISKNKTSSPSAIKSLVSQNLKTRNSETVTDPIMKFIRELHSELEIVYVGQLCLSWEILQWQYNKSIELWESDPYGIRRYNKVASELQQFQVLIQRFLENEPFEGPRVQHYVENRCVLRYLLQVPVIKEDQKKSKREEKDYEDAITSEMLVEIMEESIKILWRFIRADKDSSTCCFRNRRRAQIDPADSKMVAKIKVHLQKKEKKLRETAKGRQCILKRFKKREEESSDDHVLCFVAQVDMALVARVLNMSKLTKDQLVWCHNKLSRISFVCSKIDVDPCYLPFPC